MEKRNTFRLSNIIVRKPKFIMDEETKKVDRPIIITNHNGYEGPVYWINHFPYKYKMWGNAQFYYKSAEGKELIRQYLECKKYPQCLAGIVNSCIHHGFKKANVIPVYFDLRVYKTIQMSVEEYEKGNPIIIYADNSYKIFQTDIIEMMPGFSLLAEALMEKGYDPEIICAKSNHKHKKIIFDKPHKWSEYQGKFESNEKMLEYFQDKINKLSD